MTMPSAGISKTRAACSSRSDPVLDHHGLSTALLARVTGVDPAGFPILVLSVIGIVLSCEHMIPLLIVRRDPERVLDVLLPSFDVVAKTLRPLTAACCGWARAAERNARPTCNGETPRRRPRR